MVKYLSVGVNPPPLEKKIIVKKDSDAYEFDDGAKIIILEDKEASIDWHCMTLLSDGYSLWAEI